MKWRQEIPWTADRSTTEGWGTVVPQPSCSYSPECVESRSPFRNSYCASFHRGSGTERADFGKFRARFVVAICSLPIFSTG
jgi:hypothetical protein